MFLFNMFSRSEISSEDERYDRISFKVSLADHVPEYHSLEHQPEPEKELTESHPLYEEIFPKKATPFIEYKVTDNDTISGIAFKLQINEQAIRQLNNLSGDLYPGMTIKLPEHVDVTKLQEFSPKEETKLRISQLLSKSGSEVAEASKKYQTSYYAGSAGYIQGSVTINSNYVIFNPSLDHGESSSRFTIQRLLKFNAIVETQDIQDIQYMEIPSMTAGTEEPKILSIVQFLLYKVGNAKIEKKYKERLKELKLSHKAIASMSFAVDEGDREVGLEMVERVKAIIQKIEQTEDKESEQTSSKLTSIPFFDIIHANIQDQITVSSQEKQENSPLPPQTNSLVTILGTMTDESAILSQEEFSKLIVKFPMLYQLENWSLAYSSIRDGSSFSTFLSKCSNVEPALLLIKEYKGYRFGSFLIQAVTTGKTGRGEMFIFTFKDATTPQVFNWTMKNESFVYTEKDNGIGIGMGFKYGIFLKNTLEKGSCGATDTFGNMEILSKKEDFLVEDVEVWGIDAANY